MNLNPRIIEALTPLSLYVFPDFYDTKIKHRNAGGELIPLQDEYITFNYVNETPVIRADDTEFMESSIVDVHCFTKTGANVQRLKKQMKNALSAAEFIIENVQQTYENDTGNHHIIVTISDNNETEE